MAAVTRPTSLPAADAVAAREMDRLADDGWAWFLRYTHPRTGLTLDGGVNALNVPEPSTQASLAATGFYLSLLPLAGHLGRIKEAEAHDRALATLRFALRSIPHLRGLLLHFVHWDSGQRFGRSEYSTLDTAIFLNGAIVAASAFGGAVADVAQELVDRVEWDRLLIEDPTTQRPILSYGLHGDDRSLLPHGANVRSSENLMPVVLAAGSAAHPVGQSSWYNMAAARDLRPPIHGWTPPPSLTHLLNPLHGLFTSYYGLCWMNLRSLHDADGVDLWANARTAALFNREACRSLWAQRFATYRPANGGWWGLSAGDGPGPTPQGPDRYTVPNPVDGDPDGTVWPTAALAAFPWVVDELSEDLARWRDSAAWKRCRGPYGLASFSLDRDWVARRLLGIDLGSFILNWWNARTGLAYAFWHKNPVCTRGLDRLDFSHP